MDLIDLTRKSGDSILDSFVFNGREARLALNLGESGEQVSIAMSTSLIYSRLPRDDRQRTCFITIQNLEDLIESRNGVFVPSDGFATFMNEVREGLHLAYGLRSSQYGFAFSLVGDVKLVAIIQSLADVQVAINGLVTS